jgi:hypothetical protein
MSQTAPLNIAMTADDDTNDYLKRLEITTQAKATPLFGQEYKVLQPKHLVPPENPSNTGNRNKGMMF